MLLISLNRTLTVMLHHVAKIILTKCCKIKHVYEVLCAKQTRKILYNNIYALHRYRNFCAGTFYSDSPCILGLLLRKELINCWPYISDFHEMARQR